MKPSKFAIAIVLANPKNEKEILVVKRPHDDDSLPNVWGLPAVTINDDKLPEEAVRRVGMEKLSTTIEPVSFIGIKRTERGNYELILMDIKAKLTGTEPSVINSKTKSTKYVDQRWTSDYSILKEAALKGSLCAQIFLESQNIPY
jgi:ADP-ribose pyrophosphatase YjhB (NUDIX family)